MTHQVDTIVTDYSTTRVAKSRLILSLFPGIDLFSRPFEDLGFCVVRGPDMLLGQDIRDFHVPAGVFAGVIGGSPCPDFSAARRDMPSGEGFELLNEYRRVVSEAQPDWWLLENVPRVPDCIVDGYTWQRFPLDLAWFSDCSRLRHFQFGSRSGALLDPPLDVTRPVRFSAALANDDRSFSELKMIQGLPDDFDLPSFNVAGKKRAVGNGVPIPLGRVLAALIDRDIYGVSHQVELCVTSRSKNFVTSSGENCVTCRQGNSVTVRNFCTVTSRGFQTVTDQAAKSRCACGCGRLVAGKARYAGSACRKRASRRRVDKVSIK